MLLTRAPLCPKTSFDLHVLGLPPAFVLSQDQTLKLTCDWSEDHHNRARPKQKLHACLQDALSASNQSDLAGAACASLPCVFTLSKSRKPLGLLRRRRFRFVAVPVSGEAGLYSTAGPASTSFFSSAPAFFSEAFRGVDRSPRPPNPRRRFIGEAGVLQEPPAGVKLFFHRPELSSKPAGCLTFRPRRVSSEGRVIGPST